MPGTELLLTSGGSFDDGDDFLSLVRQYLLEGMKDDSFWYSHHDGAMNIS